MLTRMDITALILQLILLLILPTISTALVKHNIETDQYALIAFKSHVFDPSDILTKNWTTEGSVCSWSGVWCSSRHHRIVALNISFFGLHGSIAPEIGNLSFLSSLDLSGNNFHGNLPNEMVHLRRLEYINVDVNDFSGAVPLWLGFLSNLRYLSLSNNSFTGSIPISLFNASKLEALYLSFNELEGNIPEEIGYLGGLTSVNMRNNQLSGPIPRTIFNLSSLQDIGFRHNSLTGSLPLNICSKIPKLQYFDLTQNKISGQIESRFDNCSELQFLEFAVNNFSGTIPRGIGKLTNLREVYLGENFFTGEIPAEIGNLSNLESLGIEFCSLTDEDMTAHLIDFGISKFFDGGESTARTKTLATIGYIAPEYGSQRIVSTSCDIYSFGILLMETFSRKKPTDEIFREDWGLKEWVTDLLQSSTTEFIDHNLIALEDKNLNRKVQAISTIMKLSLRCTMESPEERISATDALEELKKIKSCFL